MNAAAAGVGHAASDKAVVIIAGCCSFRLDVPASPSVAEEAALHVDLAEAFSETCAAKTPVQRGSALGNNAARVFAEDVYIVPQRGAWIGVTDRKRERHSERCVSEVLPCSKWHSSERTRPDKYGECLEVIGPVRLDPSWFLLFR